MVIKGIEVKVIKGDITDLGVEAIVNAANNRLVMGLGVSAEIKRKGGSIIEEEALKLGPIKIGEAVATQAGRLSCRYVIHSAIARMPVSLRHGRQKEVKVLQADEVKIRNATKSALKLAQEKNIRSLAFPALGCGACGTDYVSCAKIMSQEVFCMMRENRQPQIKQIIFVLDDDKTKDIFEKTILGYLEYISKKIEQGPFVTVDLIIKIPFSERNGDSGVIIIERSNPPFGWALPGGFLDYAESLESAAMREAKEETSLDVFDLVQFHTYSEATRDPRFHTVSTVFTAHAEGKPRAASDAKNIKMIKAEDLDDINFAFDHREILAEYFRREKS